MHGDVHCDPNWNNVNTIVKLTCQLLTTPSNEALPDYCPNTIMFTVLWHPVVSENCCSTMWVDHELTAENNGDTSKERIEPFSPSDM